MTNVTKYCAGCQTDKSISDFGQYFCKARNRFRTISRCDKCRAQHRNKNGKTHYQRYKHKRKEYDTRHFAKAENREKSRLRYAKYRQELVPSYVAVCLARELKLSVADIKPHQNLIQAQANLWHLKRKIRHEKHA